MGFFDYTRRIFGSQSEPIIEDEDGNVLSKGDMARHRVIEVGQVLGDIKLRLELAAIQFEEDDAELSLKLRGCDELIKKGETEYVSTRPYIENRKARLEDAYLTEISFLGEELRKAEKDYEEAFDALLKSCEGGDMEYKKYMHKSLDRSRDTMPQISKSDLDKILIHFSGVSPDSKVVKKSVKLSKLKPTQSEINESKVKEMIKGGYVPDYFITSKQDYLMDAHHGWASALEQKGPDSEFTVYEIGLEPKEALRRINLIKSVSRKDIEDQVVTKAIDLVAAATEEQQQKIGAVMAQYAEGKLEGEWLCKAQVIGHAISQSGIVIEESVIEKAGDFIYQEPVGKQGYADAIIRNDEGKILMLRRSSADNFHPNEWCLPGGKMELNEEPIESAARELTEETNLVAEPGEGDLILIKENANAIIFFYDFGYLGDANALLILDGHEHDAYAWVGEKDLQQLDCIFDLKEVIQYHIFGSKVRRTPVYEKIEKSELTIDELDEDTFEKGKRAEIGEVHEWHGVKFQKTPSGWKQMKGVQHSPAKLKEHAERVSLETLTKVSKTHKDVAVRDAAKREIEERTKDIEKEKRKNQRDDQVRAEDKSDRKKERGEQWQREDKLRAEDNTLDKERKEFDDKKAKEKERKEKSKAKEKAKKQAEEKAAQDKKPKKIKPNETFSGPMTLLKNTEKAPNMGARFGQDVEPAGFYATQKETDHLDDHPNYKTFSVNIKKPMVIDVTKDRIQWKRELSAKYKAKGKSLSNKLMAEGYDSIITTDEHGYTGEIIILNTESLKEQDLIRKSDENDFGDNIEKAKRYEYVKVTRGGKTFYQYREVGTDHLEDDLPQDQAVHAEELGLQISKYKNALLITGETFKNLDLLRKLKETLGVGSWNKTLGGWIFPYQEKQTVFGALIQNMPEATFEETVAKEEAADIKNAVAPGTEITVDGETKEVESIVPTVDGPGYQVEGGDVVPETQAGIVPVNDATTVIDNANEENRFQSTKEVFGKQENESPVSDDITEAGQHDLDIQIKEFVARSGEKIEALDYTGIRQDTIQLVDQDTILDKPRPNWCPDINLVIFAGPKLDNFVFDYAKLGDDKYILALNGYEKSIYGKNVSGHKINHPELLADLKAGKYSYLDLERPENSWGNEKEGYTLKIKGKEYKYAYEDKLKFQQDEVALLNNHHAQYAVVSTDQIVAMQDYYQKYMKAVIAHKKETATQQRIAGIANWDQAKMEKYYPFSYERRLSDKQRKKYTKEQWEALPIEQKVQEVPYMKHPVVELPAGKRISQLDDQSMWMSQFSMYKKFVNKNYLTPKERGARTYTLDECVKEYNEVRDAIQWRKIDLRMQREENDSTFEKGRETSYGDVALNHSLEKSHGVKVKLQNGKEIKADKIEQIKEHLEHVYNSFGNRSEMARKFGLKISHSGDKMMHARQALGIYAPGMRAIGVSDNPKHGKFGFTLAHEFAHFIDNYLGKQKGRHYASDERDSIAGKIAHTFRKEMNKQSESDYINRTCECFARALEQYHAMKTMGDDAIKSQEHQLPYHQEDTHVPKEKFNTLVKPLIEQLLNENDHLLKSVELDFGN